MSVAALKRLINASKARAEVVYFFPDGISSKTQEIKESLELSEATDPTPTEGDVLVFLDVGGRGVLGHAEDLLSSPTEKWLVDHHQQTEEFIQNFEKTFIDREVCSSTAEIVYRGLLEEGVEVPASLDRSFLAATLVETRGLRLASCETLELVTAICRKGVSLAGASELLSSKLDVSGRIAVLKAMSRVKFERNGDWLTARTRVGAFQSYATRALMGARVDLAAATSNGEGRTKVHLRASKRLVEELGLPVGGEIIPGLMEEFGGTGGGHPTVGMATLSATPGQVLDHLKELVDSRLEDHVKTPSQN